MTTKTARNKKEASKVLEVATGLTSQVVVEEIGQLQTKLQSTLAGLSAQISSKVDQMNMVEKAIQLKQEELSELHEVEKELISLESVRNIRKSEDEDWNKSKTKRLLDWNEEQAEYEKKCKRQNDEFAYNHSKTIQQTMDALNASMEKRKREEAIRIDTLERNWKEREDNLKNREQELVTLRAESAAFVDKIKKSNSEIESITTTRLNKEFNHTIEMLKKDNQSEKSLHELKVSAMNETITNMETMIQNLNQQIADSRKDAKDVANTALQSLSGQQALKAMQQTIETQNSKK